jgi:hypothetical protein
MHLRVFLIGVYLTEGSVIRINAGQRFHGRDRNFFDKARTRAARERRSKRMSSTPREESRGETPVVEAKAYDEAFVDRFLRRILLIRDLTREDDEADEAE